MARASAFLDPRLSEYLVAHAQPRDPLLTELAAETRRALPRAGPAGEPGRGGSAAHAGPALRRPAGDRAGDVHRVFVHLHRPGSGPGGRLLCCEVSPEWTAVARRYWDLAGLTDRIELHLGPALRIVAGLPAEPRFDFAFIDAEKTEYIDYYEALVPRMARGGLIAVDNTLRHGKVAGVGEPDARTRADPRLQRPRAGRPAHAVGDRAHRGWIDPGHGHHLIHGACGGPRPALPSRSGQRRSVRHSGQSQPLAVPPSALGRLRTSIVLNRVGEVKGCPAPAGGAGGRRLHRWRGSGSGTFRASTEKDREAQPSAGSSRASATAKIFIPASSKRITTSSPARVMVLLRMVPVPYLGCRTRIPSA